MTNYNVTSTYKNEYFLKYYFNNLVLNLFISNSQVV